MTGGAATGRGIARRMCAHSLEHARARIPGDAVQLRRQHQRAGGEAWQSLGFGIVGRLPGAFRHPAYGYVDAFVMFQTL